VNECPCTVSEIRRLKMSKIDNFPDSTHIPAKIWGWSFWSRSTIWGSAERRKVGLIIREIIFEEFQRVSSQSTNVTEGRTDNLAWHANDAINALRYASRGKSSTFYSSQCGSYVFNNFRMTNLYQERLCQFSHPCSAVNLSVSNALSICF